MLQHVAHETRPGDVDAVLSFWSLLGFERVEPPQTLRERTVWVARGATQIHLLLTDDPVVPPFGHAAVVADDYDATLAALRGAGHPVESHAEHWGAPRAFVTDPSGHRVEVMSVAPPG
jgi:catechol 2,3-dioxygenase-like lactoylglutathione lyase family enzyme